MNFKNSLMNIFLLSPDAPKDNELNGLGVYS